MTGRSWSGPWTRCSSWTWRSSGCGCTGAGTWDTWEREIARQHARDAYEKYADTRTGSSSGCGPRSGGRTRACGRSVKAADNDKQRVQAQVARSEKLAGKVKASERMLERLEAVEEPRKEWEMRMTIAAAPRSGTVAAVLRSAVVTSVSSSGTRELADLVRGPGGDHRRERVWQVHADRGVARPGSADVRARVARVRGARR